MLFSPDPSNAVSIVFVIDKALCRKEIFGKTEHHWKVALFIGKLLVCQFVCHSDTQIDTQVRNSYTRP